MTIDKTFIENWKSKHPAAFSPNFPADVRTVFLDGQLKLQAPSGIDTWALWFDCLYGRSINRYLRTPGVLNVVLSFDNYDHCPKSKGPTQQKRRSRGEVPDWAELQPLPPVIPYNYDRLLFNRNFKARVVQMVIEMVAAHCKPVVPGQRVVIDYKEHPYTVQWDTEAHELIKVPVGDVPSPRGDLGESDVKFVSYLDRRVWGDIVLDAVDSDYCIIGLCQLETMLGDEHRGAATVPRIYVRRLQVHAAGMKRVRGDECGGGGAAPQGAATSSLARKYEFVSCETIVNELHRSLRAKTPATLQGHIVRILAHAVALSGCDFTRGISWFTGGTVSTNMALLWPAFCQAARLCSVPDPRSPSGEQVVLFMDSRDVAEKMLGTLWRRVQFKKQCAGDSVAARGSFESLYGFLSQNSAVSAFRRERLITPQELHCLVRNANWTVWYWSNPASCPCAVDGGFDFGFKYTGSSAATAKPRVVFDDKKALPC